MVSKITQLLEILYGTKGVLACGWMCKQVNTVLNRKEKERKRRKWPSLPGSLSLITRNVVRSVYKYSVFYFENRLHKSISLTTFYI